jgi:hypothetical protein
MIKKNEEQQDRLKKMFRKVKAIYGNIPPQMEFLGNIDVDYLEEFLVSILRIAKHPNIESNLFGFIRLHVAFRENYPYCKMFNTKLLLSHKYTQEILDEVIKDIENVPFDTKHKLLAKFAIKAIYDSKNCFEDDFDKLYSLGWSQKDVFDLVEHAGTILRNGRILTAYSLKEPK